MPTLQQIDIPGGHGTMEIVAEDGSLRIVRKAARGKVTNTLSHYEEIQPDGSSQARPLTEDIARTILKRVVNGWSYAASYIFSDTLRPELDLDMSKTEMEHKYTSTGIKFWQHQQQMEAFKAGYGNTVISSHISPEGACNLKCPYCSVTYRDTHSRIPGQTIQKYVENLQTRGLKALIFTGGGEPTIYPHFNEMIRWAKGRGLSVALITNGTKTSKVDPDVWGMFSWVRISLNVFNDWENVINLPKDLLNPECVVGCSMIYTTEHQATDGTDASDRLGVLRKAAKVADRVGAKYIRLLPNCLLPQHQLLLMHRALDRTIQQLGDDRFFHQHKAHGAPQCGTCHQAYFRPYLSEEKFHGNGLPGTVYPCDSVVLNDSYQHFAQEYQICHADDILDFIDGKIKMRFDPKLRCPGCVFTHNVNMLDDWKVKGVGSENFGKPPIPHAEFV